MKKNTRTGGVARSVVFAGLLSLTLVGCGAASTASTAARTSQTSTASSLGATEENAASVVTTLAPTTTDGALETADLFTDRDLEQTADASSAKSIVVESDKDVTITEEGVYVLSGNATNVTVYVNVDSSQKVQLVLDGLTIKNDDAPAISVESADKVFVTTAQGSTNDLSCTGTFVATDETNYDAVIFSKDDLVLNGQGSLSIASSANGISSHDDLKITGGSYTIDSTDDALEANNDVLIAGGTFAITTNKDGIHAENDEDDTKGNVYIADGTFAVTAADDVIHAVAVVQIDGGSFELDGAEAIEGTYVQINGGTLAINASDDGINAAAKSSALTPTIEIRGGEISIVMGSGDTDALDANGNLSISGGTVNITAQSPFDYDGTGELTGGTVYVNGEQVTELQNSMMGGPGGGMGGMGGRDNMAPDATAGVGITQTTSTGQVVAG